MGWCGEVCGGGGWLEECVAVRRYPIFLFIVGVILVLVHKGLSVLSLMCNVRVCECVCVCECVLCNRKAGAFCFLEIIFFI